MTVNEVLAVLMDQPLRMPIMHNKWGIPKTSVAQMIVALKDVPGDTAVVIEVNGSEHALKRINVRDDIVVFII